MLVTIKIGAIIVVVWFYLTAKGIHENRFQWAAIGLVGYLLTFAIAIMTIAEPIVSMILGVVACYFVRVVMLRVHAKEKAKLT